MVVGLSHNFDLLTEILRRLPAKSLMRFKSVCKSWRDQISCRYFCLLWRQHQHHDRGPGILLMSGTNYRHHRYVLVSGPAAGLPQFELPYEAHPYVLQSCNGFLLQLNSDGHGNSSFSVYNPATSESVVLPPLRMLDACKLHARHCDCEIGLLVLAFDSQSHGRVFGLAKHERGHQVCVAKNQRPWRSSSKPFPPGQPSVGVHWHRFVVWIYAKFTLIYEVEDESLRVCDPPHSSVKDQSVFDQVSYSYHLGESGGHLHFMHLQGSCILIHQMNHDVSGWFMKHNIELTLIEASLFRSISWGVNSTDLKLKINFLMEEKEDSKLVLSCRDELVLYRIRDQKSWKLCEMEYIHGFTFVGDECFQSLSVHPHVENICRFYEQY